MINRKKFIIIFSTLFLLAVATSFTLSRSTDNKPKWIPEDFNPKNVILLIETHPYNEKQNDRLIEYVEKEYHWRYEIVSFEQMQKNEKYKDKKLYQFALLWSDKESRTKDPGSRIVYRDIDGHFLDRSNDTEYPNSDLGNGYGQIGYKKVISSINKHFKDVE